MFKKNLSAVSVFILSFLIFFTSQVNAAPAQTKRLWGKDRYQTCSAIVNEGWKTSEYAVVVNGENFPDALSASTLAKKYNAPILLTQDNTLDTNAIYQLKRLDVKKVFIVGGNFVVKPAVENAIHNLGIATERFYGQDRNETSVAVAKQIGTENGIILTTDSDFTDALSVAPIAAKLQMPIILMTKNSIPSSVSNFIAGKNIPKTYVLGESDLISDNVVSKFPNIERIPGKDKYERNINIINAFNNKFDFKNAYLAYSEKFADALSGSALAALNGNPIILSGNTISSTTKQFILNKNFSNINILGGTSGINEACESILNGSINESDIIKSKSVYKFNMKDNNEKVYSAYIYSDDVETKTASFNSEARWASPWAGASDGDILHKGYFKIAVINENKDIIDIQDINSSDTNNPFYSEDNKIILNSTRKLVRVHKNIQTGNPDFLLIGMPASSNGSYVKMYYIKDGKLNKVKFPRSNDSGSYDYMVTFNSSSLFFNQTEDNTFETSSYDMMETCGFYIHSRKFNLESGTFIYLGNRFMNRDDYFNYAKKIN